jgi:hypothetical protein
MEIVHGTGGFYAGETPRLYAWELDGAAVQPGWPVNTSAIGRIMGSPALADLDGDEVPEVVVTTRMPDGSLHYLAAYRGNGTQVFTPVVVRELFGNSLSAGDPVVGDVFDGGASDDDPEILVPTNSEIAVFSKTGARLTDIDGFDNEPGPPSLNGQFTVNNVAVADLESGVSDGQIEILMVSAQPFTPPPQATNTVVHVWTPVDRATEPQWGQFRHDPRHLGVAADCDVLLENQTVFGLTEVTSCGIIRVQDVTVSGSGILTLEASDQVVLGGSGTEFQLDPGGSLRVRTGS